MGFEKIVEDFMLPVERYGHVAEGDTLKTAVAELRRAEAEGRPPYLIVVGPREDGGEEVRGFISPPSLVFGMAEHFLRGTVRTGPIFWEGQLRTECRVALQRKVADVMTPFETGINHREMIMEAIFLMNKYQLFFLPVIRDEGVAGVIHLEDVMKEIIRIGDDATDRKTGDTQPNSSQEKR